MWQCATLLHNAPHYLFLWIKAIWVTVTLSRTYLIEHEQLDFFNTVYIFISFSFWFSNEVVNECFNTKAQRNVMNSSSNTKLCARVSHVWRTLGLLGLYLHFFSWNEHSPAVAQNRLLSIYESCAIVHLSPGK